MLSLPSLDRPTPAPQPPYLRKSKPSLPSAKALANRSQNDHHASDPLPLSQREQQVCEYLSQGLSFEAIANHLNCSPAAARAYYRRALSKRQRTIALASHEQGDSSAPRVRKATAKPELALAKVPQMHRGNCRSGDERSPHQRPSLVSESFAPRVRPSSALASICERSPFHSPAVDVSALLERPNSLDLCVSSLFVKGNSVTTGRSHSFQTTITDHPPRPRRRKLTSRRSRYAGVGFRVAIAS